MTTTPITLYDLSPEPGVSPYAERVKIALTELGLPYTVRLEAGAASGASKSEEFLRLFRGLVQDPEARGTLPTIADGDYKLTESLIIVEYLDKKYGKPENRLLPNDAAQHGKVKLFVETFQSQLISNTLRLIMADTRAALADAAKSTDAALKVLDNFIKVNGIAEGGNFFLGSKYSFAEVATTPFVWIAIIVLPQVGKYDMLQSIKANHLERLELWIEVSLAIASWIQVWPVRMTGMGFWREACRKPPMSRVQHTSLKQQAACICVPDRCLHIGALCLIMSQGWTDPIVIVKMEQEYWTC